MNDKRSSPQIEPGIIPLFRAFVILQLVVMVWNWVTSIRTPRFMLWGRFPQLNQWFSKAYLRRYLPVNLLPFGSLFGLYSGPTVSALAGEYYLPVALIVQVFSLSSPTTSSPSIGSTVPCPLI